MGNELKHLANPYCDKCGGSGNRNNGYYNYPCNCVRMRPLNIGLETTAKTELNINFEEEPVVIAKNDFEMEIRKICEEIADTLIRKNRDYGDSYRKMKEEFGDTALIIRQSDKLERLKTLQKQGNLVQESIRDTKLDGAGYYILDLACERVMK